MTRSWHVVETPVGDLLPGDELVQFTNAFVQTSTVVDIEPHPDNPGRVIVTYNAEDEPVDLAAHRTVLIRGDGQDRDTVDQVRRAWVGVCVALSVAALALILAIFAAQDARPITGQDGRDGARGPVGPPGPQGPRGIPGQAPTVSNEPPPTFATTTTTTTTTTPGAP